MTAPLGSGPPAPIVEAEREWQAVHGQTAPTGEPAPQAKPTEPTTPFKGRQAGSGVNVLGNFVKDDVVPALQKTWKAITDANAGIARILGRRAGQGADAGAAMSLFAKADSEVAAQNAALEKAIAPLRDQFNQEIAGDPDAGMRAIRNIESGAGAATPSGSALATMNDKLNKLVKGLQIKAGNPNAPKWNTDAFFSRAGNSPLVGWLDVNGLREDQPGYQGPDPNRGGGGSFAGAEKSRMSRTFNTMDEMASHIVNEGGYLKSTNPVDWLMAGAADRLRSAYYRLAVKDAINEGIVRETTKDDPTKYRLSDKLFQEGHPIWGKRYGTDDPNTAAILNHAADPNPLMGNKGAQFLLAANQEVRRWKMALGTFSHLFREDFGARGVLLGGAFDSATKGNFSTGLRQLEAAVPGWGLRPILKAAANYRSALENPGVNPEQDRIVQAITAGGAVRHPDINLAPEPQQTPAQQALALGNPLGAAIRGASKVLSAPSNLVFNKSLPPFQEGLRAIRAMADIAEADRVGEPLDSPQFRDRSFRSQQAIDQLLGRVGADKDYQQKTANMVGRMLFNFPAWDLGKINLAGQSIGDLGYAIKNRKISPAMQALGGTLAAHALAGTAMYMATNGGSLPTNLKDAYYPPIPGWKDRNGNPIRFAFPDPLDNLLALATGAQTPETWAVNRLASIPSLAKQYIQNEDYRGRATRDTVGDVAATAGREIGEPMMGSRLLDSGAPGGIPGQLTRMVTGYGPSNESLNRTPAETLAHQLQQATMGNVPMTDDEAKQADAHRAIRDAYGQSPDAGDAAAKQARASGVDITARQQKLLAKEGSEFARQGDLIYTTDRLPILAAMKVFAAASPDEKKALQNTLIEKVGRSQESKSEKVQQLYQIDPVQFAEYAPKPSSN